MSFISAVVVDHGTPEKAVALVRDLRASPRVRQVVIVENGGPWPEGLGDPSDLGATVVETENRGYGAAVNVGIALATEELLLVSNADLRIPDPAVMELLASELDDAATGLVGPTILRPDGSPDASVSSASPCLRDSIARRLRASPLPPGRHLVDNLTGALLVLRRTTWDLVGGFDEGYFMYFEDAEMCRRVAGLGLHLVRSHAVVVHEVGGSGGPDARRSGWYAASQLRFFRRWRPRWEVLVLRLLRRSPPASRG